MNDVCCAAVLCCDVMLFAALYAPCVLHDVQIVLSVLLLYSNSGNTTTFNPPLHQSNQI
jgi:hypothetical protein